MATKVYETLELELQDGTVVEIRPLNIKSLRKFMEIVENMDKVEKETDAIEHMVAASAIAIERTNPELAADTERLEEVLDLQTMWKILEIAGGVSNDPNPMARVTGRP